MLALNAMNYSCIWRTGKMAFNEMVQQELSLSNHQEVLGYLYIGTEVGDKKITYSSVSGLESEPFRTVTIVHHRIVRLYHFIINKSLPPFFSSNSISPLILKDPLPLL